MSDELQSVHPAPSTLPEALLALEKKDEALEKKEEERQKALRLLARSKDSLVSIDQANKALVADNKALQAPINSYGTIIARCDDETVDILTSNQEKRTHVLLSEVAIDDLKPGMRVRLNEALCVIAIADQEVRGGEVVTVKELIDNRQVLVTLRHDEERICLIAHQLEGSNLKTGDLLLMDTRNGFVYQQIAKTEVNDLLLDETPNVSYSDVRGLDSQIDKIQDAVETPYLHPELYADHDLTAPKGVLLYGPPGCGKTLIAKAIATSLAQRVSERTSCDRQATFISIGGPEILNKYVGETESTIRKIFQRARDKAADGNPVVIFFDEMESLFRTRGSGISSDMESTIVPQLLAELDGVEGLSNVLVVGASNREDTIDPAVLRPGRFDVKIKIERPDAEGALDIASLYLKPSLPIHPQDLAENGGSAQATMAAMAQRLVEVLFEESEQNRFIEVAYFSGEKEIHYFKDFVSGAAIKSIVDRAKQMSIKATIASGVGGIRAEYLLEAVRQEFTENSDLPGISNPSDWPGIARKKGEKIAGISRLLTQQKTPTMKPVQTVANPGQYL